MASKALITFITSPKQTNVLLLVMLIVLCPNLYGQVQQISAINISTQTPTASSYVQTAPDDASGPPTAGNNYTVNNGTGTDDVVTSFTIDEVDFSNFVKPDTFALRRTDGGRFVNIWYETVSSPNTTYNLGPSAASDADAIYLLEALNAGYDNILVNNDDLANNTIQAQIERVDVLWYNGIVTSTPENAIFSIVERGGNDQIKVAAVLSLDINGNPDSYSNMITINGDENGTTNDWPGTGQSYGDFLILRRQAIGDDPLPLLELGGQTVQGVAVAFDDLGVSPNQIVYGYSIFASDVDDTDPDIDLTDIFTFPTTTLSSVSGLDLIASVTTAVASDDNLVKATGPGGYKRALATWLKANEETDITNSTNNANVTNWQDHWIGNNDFATGFAAPSYINDGGSNVENINFNQSVDFSGSTSLSTPNNTDFNVTGQSSPDNFYAKKGINMVFRTDASDINSRQVLYEQGAATRGLNIYIENGSLNVSAWNRASDGAGSPWNDATTLGTFSTAITINTEYILTFELDGNSTSNGATAVYLNGELFGTANVAGYLYDHGGGIELGASDGSIYPSGSNSDPNYFEGEIAELIYCNEPSEFPFEQRNRIESYLALKYGITLDQNPSQQNYVNANGEIIFNTNLATSLGGFEDYDFDIAGIARDDQSEFEQPASRSENDGSVITIDRGSSFPNDNTFLIWGNDNGSTDETNSDVPSLIRQRTTRTWRVAETGESGNVSISFDLSELAFTITGATPVAGDFTLLIAETNSNGSMSGASIITGGSINGNTLTFDNVNFSAGQFFTLGTGFISCSPGGVDSNIEIWLKANLGTGTTVDGNTISTWEDQAGSNDATSTNSPSYNANSINFNPSVDFNSSQSDYFLIPNGSLPDFENQFLALIGSQSISSGAYAPYIIKTSTYSWDDGWGIAKNTGSSALQYHRDDYVGTFPIDPDFDNPSLLTAWTDGTDDFFSLDFADPTSTVSQGNSNNTTSPVAIGATPNGAGSGYQDFLDGSIGEIIVYSDELTETERLRVASYLAIKYGVTLDQSTGQNYLASDAGVIWNSTSNSGYSNDIAGIGRDDDSCLEQKQSKSNNDNSIVTIGNNSIASNNIENPNSFSNNDSFLVWGNDGTTTNSQNTDVPTGVGDRITRVWRVQETGTVGNASISFDLTGLGYGNNASSFKLIIAPSASNGTIANGSTISGGSMNGNVITFNNVDFIDGDYFTLGVTNSITCGPGGITTGLSYWLRADQGTDSTTDGTAVGTWNDQSANARNATETNLGGAVPVEPLYQAEKFNFNPAIEISDPGSSNATYMASAAGTNVANDLSLITVFSTGQAGGSTTDFEAAPTFLSNGVANNNEDYGLGISEGRVHMNASNDANLDARSPVGTTYNNFEPYILVGTRQQSTASGSIQMYVNGNNVASGTSSNTALSGNNNNANYGVGNHDDPNEASQLQGFIAEAIVFGQDLSNADRNKVESYLAVKYGITKANNGFDYSSSQNTAIWDFDENTTYNNDIAGIGRDDASCFTQLKSKSENDDALVTMEVSNLGTDDSWLIWANDNVQIEGTGEDGNEEYNSAQVNSRLFREWRVQENGNVGTVTITYDLSTITGPLGTGTNNLNLLRLMVDSDGDFRNGTSLVEPSAIDAVNKTVSFTYDFNDGEYYTLGSLEIAALPITLVTFEARSTIQNTVLLTWTTADETNNAFFTIERSSSGKDFEVLGRLDGAGNSSSSRNYQFMDNSPKNGFNFYRLKQTDFNGTFDYSSIQTVDIQLPEKLLFNVYPNPVKKGDALSLRYSSVREQKVLLHIFDTNGQIYYRKEITLIEGQETLIIETDNLSKGLKLIRIIDENQQVQVFKVIID